MSYPQRHLCLRTLKEELEKQIPGNCALLAQEIEHANRCMACTCPLSYMFQIQTTLVHIQSGKLFELLQASPNKSVVEILSLPRDILFDTLPCYNKVEEEDRKQENGLSLLNLHNREEINDVPDAGIACGRCKSKDIIYSTGQTRSADEGSTVWATCQSCSKRWKM